MTRDPLDRACELLSRMVTALAWVEAEVAEPDYCGERIDEAERHLKLMARTWMAEPATRLPAHRMAPPTDGRSAAIVYFGLLALIVAILAMLATLPGCTIRDSRDYNEGVADLAPAADLPPFPICGTLLPGRLIP